MNCPHCGAALPEGASFCQVCGRALVSQPPAPKERLGLPITALILGVGSFLLFPLTFLPALVLSVIGLIRASRRQPAEKTAIGMCIGGLVCMLVAMPMWLAILFPVFAKAREKAQESRCLSNMNQLALGFVLYVADWDAHMPLAENWQDAILPKLSGSAIPFEQLVKCPGSREGFGYGYNRALGGLAHLDIKCPVYCVLLFEMDAKGNASGGRENLAAPRHPVDYIFAYADGHCKPLSRPFLSNALWGPSEVSQSGVGVR